MGSPCILFIINATPSGGEYQGLCRVFRAGPRTPARGNRRRILNMQRGYRPREAWTVQPLVTRFRDHVSPSVAHVPEAAEVLAIGEFELFRLAHRWWHEADCDDALLDRAFNEYLMHETVPPWVRHYCRRVLILAAVGQLDPADFGVDGPSVRRFSTAEQRFGSAVTLLAFVVYLMFFA